MKRGRKEFEAEYHKKSNLLHCAAKRGNVQRIHSILKNDLSELNLQDEKGRTPLHLAVLGGHLQSIKALYSYGAKYTLYDYYGLTPLELAAPGSSEYETLISIGVKERQISVLHQAIQLFDEKRVRQLLLSDKSLINVIDFAGYTPLHIAIKNNQIDIVTLLLNAGADMNAFDKVGFPPIYYAQDLPEIAKVLRQYGANEFDLSMMPPDLSYSELHLAAVQDNIRDIKKLIRKDRKLLNSMNRMGNTPLHEAVLIGNFKAVSELIRCGADINSIDNEGNSPLLSAISADRLDIVRVLIEGGADIELADQNLETPLQLAVVLQNQDIVRFLIQEGANAEVIDAAQLNIIEKAKIDGKHNNLSKLIKDYIRLPDEYQKGFNKKFHELLKYELNLAKENEKKILIILGEHHGDYKIYQLEKQMLQIASELGITTLYKESGVDGCDHAIDILCRNKYHMTVVPVDTHPNRSDVTVEERNIYIKNEISKQDQAGVFITGCEHLYGLLKECSSKIDRAQYHILPINLASIIKHDYLPQTSHELHRCEFMDDPINVIQILLTEECFSPARPVLEKLNKANKIQKNESCWGSPIRVSGQSPHCTRDFDRMIPRPR